MAEQNYVDFNFKARYYLSHPISDKSKYLFIAFHGYGQLARYFIRNFESLGEEFVTLVPEGLHRFYKDGMEGRVVASWMTKEDRLMDIENQSSYLNQILNQVFEDGKGKELKIVLFGFSQGVATLLRWVVRNNINFHAAIFWAGSIAEDLNVNEVSTAFKDIPSYFVIGDKDPFFSEEYFSKQLALARSYSINIERIDFKGDHRVFPDVLDTIIKQKIEIK